MKKLTVVFSNYANPPIKDFKDRIKGNREFTREWNCSVFVLIYYWVIWFLIRVIVREDFQSKPEVHIVIERWCRNVCVFQQLFS